MWRYSATFVPYISCLSTQAAAFDSWVEAVHSARYNKQVLAKALKRIVSLKLSQAFDWWRHQVEALRIARAKAGQIIIRMQHQSLAVAFAWWVDAVAESQQAASQQEQLVDAAVTRRRSLLQGQAFKVSSTASSCARIQMCNTLKLAVTSYNTLQVCTLSACTVHVDIL